MKHLLLFITLTGFICLVQGQQNRFNTELDAFCQNAVNKFDNITVERKLLLDEIAQQLTHKRYIVFTCSTNSRRTHMLQVWAQTAFYYYGLFGKYAFSTGSKVTDVYPGVAGVLSEAGFTCTYLKSVEPNGYVISINKNYPISILSSKNEIGTVDTSKGIVVSICMEDEEQDTSISFLGAHLPYQSPKTFEQTPQERQNYRALNSQIATEMLYLSERIKTYLLQLEETVK